jgi:hypothetical protein
MQEKIIIWDNNGTIVGAKDPNDTTNAAKVILPGVEFLMNQDNTINMVCSGGKRSEGELHNFDPEKIVAHFEALMEKLPITAAVFSPDSEGNECWVMVKDSCCGGVDVIKAHEDLRYEDYIGKFKKPDLGMFVVIKDMLEELELVMSEKNTVMIGDSWHDEVAAQGVGIGFIHANVIHGVATAKSAAKDNNEQCNI